MSDPSSASTSKKGPYFIISPSLYSSSSSHKTIELKPLSLSSSISTPSLSTSSSSTQSIPSIPSISSTEPPSLSIDLDNIDPSQPLPTIEQEQIILRFFLMKTQQDTLWKHVLSLSIFIGSFLLFICLSCSLYHGSSLRYSIETKDPAPSFAICPAFTLSYTLYTFYTPLCLSLSIHQYLPYFVNFCIFSSVFLLLSVGLFYFFQSNYNMKCTCNARLERANYRMAQSTNNHNDTKSGSNSMKKRFVMKDNEKSEIEKKGEKGSLVWDNNSSNSNPSVSTSFLSLNPNLSVSDEDESMPLIRAPSIKQAFPFKIPISVEEIRAISLFFSLSQTMLVIWSSLIILSICQYIYFFLYLSTQSVSLSEIPNEWSFLSLFMVDKFFLILFFLGPTVLSVLCFLALKWSDDLENMLCNLYKSMYNFKEI
jgi:hypothetical protein